MDINKYLLKQYSQPPCFEAVADIYVNELGFALPNYVTKDPSLKSIANAFRIALHTDHGFVQLEKPVDYCVVLMSKLANNNPHHIGVYYKGKVFHALPFGNLYQDLYSLTDQFKLTEYWALDED